MPRPRWWPRSSCSRRAPLQKDQFFSILSHDLREPLRMVTGFLGLLQRQAGELDARQREYLNHANDGARRLVLMLESLLRYGRTGRGRAPRLTSLEQALETARTRLEERCAGIPATWSVGALPEVMADPEQLVELLVELLANALVFHTGERAEIAVEAVRGDACWILAVSDRGIGIPQQEAQPRARGLLPPGMRGDAPIPAAAWGSAIANRIAQQHGAHAVDQRRSSRWPWAPARARQPARPRHQHIERISDPGQGGS